MAKAKQRRKIYLNIGMDLSGKPPETVYVGLVSFSIFNQDEIIEEIKSIYPNI